MLQSPERIILVTGASRGVGADVARRIAGADTHVIVNHCGRPERAEAVAQAIRDAGGHASTIAADVHDEFAVAAMIETIRARFGRLDALILNASGDDPHDAVRVKGDVHRRLATRAMPLMPTGARIVFVTSHQAHFYPDKAVPKGYAGVAASQRAAETALYAMRSQLAHAGIGFTVVSAEMTGETVTAPAVVNAATTAQPVGIVYVGGAAHLMTA
ncbi:SDR family oxidoreductase [Mycolicibacterium austroafricanum]|uniref:SDR family oxidoreductase n=1 Tax=Mycolicibacterium austroafricanum TaxID=39687 RepID=UPI001ABF9911|nr:SDR family oxidoreductase [Mycolicibacterium austroafricanum]QRZ08268.1 SDR family oxidoreductase [Mycolicibacterium austroafricanum]QZT69920.1 SDR family oxidoreductase [Mycolicibacterium austroafricanum]